MTSRFCLLLRTVENEAWRWRSGRIICRHIEAVIEANRSIFHITINRGYPFLRLSHFATIACALSGTETRHHSLCIQAHKHPSGLLINKPLLPPLSFRPSRTHISMLLTMMHTGKPYHTTPPYPSLFVINPFLQPIRTHFPESNHFPLRPSHPPIHRKQLNLPMRKRQGARRAPCLSTMTPPPKCFPPQFLL